MSVVACIVPVNPATAKPPTVQAELFRQPVGVVTDWMQAVADECARHSTFCPPIIDFLKRTGLINQCVFLVGQQGGPLTFRYIGEPTVRVMGRAWAARQLGRPVIEADGTDFTADMYASYAEAVDGSDPVVNRIVLTGLIRPLTYTHSLIGWETRDGRRAVLSCVQL